MPTDATTPGRTADVGGVRLRYLDHAGGEPPLVLLHGLSANAHSFGGLVAAGLAPAHRVIAPDLRGRGASDKPATGYTMADHARDVLGLLDHLGLGRVVLGGHSFGALLSIYMAARHAERVERVVVIDASLELQPQVRELLRPSLERLELVHASADEYLARIREAPYIAGMWDEALEAYYRAEIAVGEDGTARSVTSAAAIAQALDGVVAEPWPELARQVMQPVLLLNALEPYGPAGSPPLILPEHARAAADIFPDARYVAVPGNHLTLVFGAHASIVCREILAFVAGSGRTHAVTPA